MWSFFPDIEIKDLSAANGHNRGALAGVRVRARGVKTGNGSSPGESKR